jgi:hypothetical protein
MYNAPKPDPPEFDHPGFDRGEHLVARRLWGLSLIFLLIPYLLSRLFIMIEIFRSLFYLPPEAFLDTWSGSFPHWG